MYIKFAFPTKRMWIFFNKILGTFDFIRISGYEYFVDIDGEDTGNGTF